MIYLFIYDLYNHPADCLIGFPIKESPLKKVYLGDVGVKPGADDGSDESLVPGVSVGGVGLHVLRVDELHLVQVLGKLALHVLRRIKINLLILRQLFLRHYLEKMVY